MTNYMPDEIPIRSVLFNLFKFADPVMFFKVSVIAN